MNNPHPYPLQENFLPTGAAAPIDESRQILPAGTITFLFTDIQGSTPLWESHPDEMAAALQIHNNILCQAIQIHGGVVFKVVGDAFQSAFPTAPQALKAAIAGQRALLSATWNELGPLRVRMGLHTGEAELDPGGDEYAVSHTKNRAARIMSAAHGGQVLLSVTVADLLQGRLPEGVSLKDMGEHHLKGLLHPEHIFQVIAPGLPSDFPPLKSVTRPRHNLPRQLTSFIGREKEIARVAALLQDHRLLTLTGSGGTGKTRLAIQVAAEVLERFPEGAWLVELAPLADPELVPQAVASVLGVRETPGMSLTASLRDALEQKRLLLILDNCEHLVDSCAALTGTLLHACPYLAILATSREILGVEGETPFRVPSLSTPDVHHLPSLGELAGYDAIRLFIERAQVASPGFRLLDQNAASVAQIVRRLDGIPLAIELTAARLRVLDVEQIALRLNDAFRLLTGGSRTVLPRHQTLLALIDWSYNLLSTAERRLLRRLSVFAGGWTLEAAEAVCSISTTSKSPAASDAEAVCSISAISKSPAASNAETVSADDRVLDLLSQLVDKSLVQAVCEPGSSMRYTMLEIIRQYAHQKFSDENQVDPAEGKQARDRHLAYFLQMAEALEPNLRGRQQVKTLDLLEKELDNLRLALEWALQADVEAELRLASSSMYFWHIHNRWSEGVMWLDQGLALEEATHARQVAEGQPFAQSRRALIRAKALACAGYQLSLLRETTRAKLLAEESQVLYRELGQEHSPGMAFALVVLAFSAGFCGQEVEAAAFAKQALVIFKETNDRFNMAECLIWIGRGETDPDLQRQAFLEELAIVEDLGDEDGIATALSGLGLVALSDGEYDRAEQLFQQSLKHYRTAGNATVGMELAFLGITSFFDGDCQQAAQRIAEALAIFKEIGDASTCAECAFWQCELALSRGAYAEAAQYLEDGLSLARGADAQSKIGRAFSLRGRLARIHGNLAQAVQDGQKGVEIYTKISHRDDLYRDEMGRAKYQLGTTLLFSGEILTAESLFKESLQDLFLDLLAFFIAYPLEGLASLALRHGNMPRAARLYGAAERWLRGMTNALSPVERAWRNADLTSVRAALGEDVYRILWEEGRAMTRAQMMAYALDALGEGTVGTVGS